MIDDAQIIAEAIKLVGEGVSVTFPVAGRSMRPFIVGGKESVVLVKPESVKIIPAMWYTALFESMAKM